MRSTTDVGGAPPRDVPAWLRELPFAHRGLHGPGVPENACAAFAAARDAGFGVELDVRLSRDRVPVVVHDTSLRRVTGVRGRVDRRTAAELSTLRLHGTDERVPTLRQALDVLGGTPVMVEVKSLGPGAARVAAATAAVLDDHPGPVCVAAFDPTTLRWFRRHRPTVARVLTSRGAAGSGLPGPIARRLARLADLDAVAPAAVSYALDGLPTPAVDAWRQAGGVTLAWTVRTERELARAATVADNVIFEHVRP